MITHLRICFVLCIALFSGNVAAQYSYEFTQKIYSASGVQELGNANWTLSTDAGYFGYDLTKGQQIGSEKNPASTLTFATSDIIGTISEVTIETSGASSIGANLTINVGNTGFGDSYQLTTTSTSHTFTGSATGKIELKYNITTGKAIYIKAIKITSSTDGGEIIITPSITKVNGIAEFSSLSNGTEALLYWSDEAKARVTYVYGKNAYIRDNSGALCLYGFDTNPTIAYNQHLVGYITGVKGMVGNMPVMQASTRTNTSMLAIASPVTEDNVLPKVISTSEFPQHYADWVTINNLTMQDTQTGLDATGFVTVVNSFNTTQYTTPEIGKIYNISGIVNSTLTSGDRLSPIYNNATTRTQNPNVNFNQEFLPISLTSGINNSSNLIVPSPAIVYDLIGRRIDPANMQKGIYIVNRKKIVK